MLRKPGSRAPCERRMNRRTRAITQVGPTVAADVTLADAQVTPLNGKTCGDREFFLPFWESHGESHRDRGRILQEHGGPCGTGGVVSETPGDAAAAVGRRRAEV